MTRPAGPANEKVATRPCRSPCKCCDSVSLPRGLAAACSRTSERGRLLLQALHIICSGDAHLAPFTCSAQRRGPASSRANCGRRGRCLRLRAGSPAVRGPWRQGSQAGGAAVKCCNPRRSNHKPETQRKLCHWPGARPRYGPAGTESFANWSKKKVKTRHRTATVAVQHAYTTPCVPLPCDDACGSRSICCTMQRALSAAPGAAGLATAASFPPALACHAQERRASDAAAIG